MYVMKSYSKTLSNPYENKCTQWTELLELNQHCRVVYKAIDKV